MVVCLVGLGHFILQQASKLDLRRRETILKQEKILNIMEILTLELDRLANEVTKWHLFRHLIS
ncbi:hypothetical protein BpHYR1_008732 [Brachionus plicatilis]|uniref:Uncharacterized protein n=1 Tax=Brachionus plicatilis TaxID=10195 RepID=A0A3M7SQN7_BRAPC|nr:hypothetical protein BpHYR1_008732 [Brachionus plicatilis]